MLNALEGGDSELDVCCVVGVLVDLHQEDPAASRGSSSCGQINMEVGIQ